MGTEIERKFLVVSDAWRKGAEAVSCRQAYLWSDPRGGVRVRVMGERAYLTIKGDKRGITRSEFEYEIPRADAEELIDRYGGGRVVEKTRYTLAASGRHWEVDVFEGRNRGLTVAEMELQSEDEVFDLPPWVGEEVSNDSRYVNANLARHPYGEWGGTLRSITVPR